MSYTSLCAINEVGEVLQSPKEHRNSHGGAAFIWTALCEKYNILDERGSPYFDAWKMLWRAVSDGRVRIEPYEYNVLYFTYDDALVKHEHMQLLADSLRLFSKEHHRDHRSNHCDGFAREIESWIKGGHTYGVGLYTTSVMENPWYEWDEEEDDSIPYNINTGTKHWFVEMRELDDGPNTPIRKIL